MKRLDLIIDALKLACHETYGLAASDCYSQALAAARELRAMGPVAWVYKDNTVTTDPDRADGTWTKLYALGDDK